MIWRSGYIVCNAKLCCIMISPSVPSSHATMLAASAWRSTTGLLCNLNYLTCCLTNRQVLMTGKSPVCQIRVQCSQNGARGLFRLLQTTPAAHYAILCFRLRFDAAAQQQQSVHQQSLPALPQSPTGRHLWSSIQCQSNVVLWSSRFGSHSGSQAGTPVRRPS